jgi:hypothetical protein
MMMQMLSSGVENPCLKVKTVSPLSKDFTRSKGYLSEYELTRNLTPNPLSIANYSDREGAKTTTRLASPLYDLLFWSWTKRPDEGGESRRPRWGWGVRFCVLSNKTQIQQVQPQATGLVAGDSAASLSPIPHSLFSERSK